jgi:hypothetical protein
MRAMGRGKAAKLIYRLGVTRGAQMDTEMIIAYGTCVVGIVRLVV